MFAGVKENALKRVIYIEGHLGRSPGKVTWEGHLAVTRNMSDEDKTVWMY